MGSDQPGGCDGGTPAGTAKRQFCGGSLPYTPYVTSSGTVGVRGMFERIESKGLTGVMGVIDRVTPGVNQALRSTYPPGAAPEGVISA